MGITYALNVGVGLVALQMVNVPMFFCLRRLVAPMILLYEFLVLGRVAPLGVRGAVGVIVAGTLMAGWGTLSNDLLGYTLTLANNVLTAAASVLQKQVSERSKLSTVGIVYANALIAAPLSIVLLLLVRYGLTHCNQSIAFIRVLLLLLLVVVHSIEHARCRACTV